MLMKWASAPKQKEENMKLSDCIIRVEQLEPYSPESHQGTVNRRIIGKETVGSKNLEMVLGSLSPDGIAEPHFHTGIEQVIYVLEGRLEVEMLGETQIIEPGDTVYIPPGEMHKVTVLGNSPAKLIILYTPPIQLAQTQFER
jgi:quercetin dioxygenase-like cupin family protein